jgi:hypothetical protein
VIFFAARFVMFNFYTSTEFMNRVEFINYSFAEKPFKTPGERWNVVDGEVLFSSLECSA